MTGKVWLRRKTKQQTNQVYPKINTKQAGAQFIRNSKDTSIIGAAAKELIKLKNKLGLNDYFRRTHKHTNAFDIWKNWTYISMELIMV